MKRFYILLCLALALLVPAARGATDLARTAEELRLPQLDDCFTERDLLGAWDATATQIALEGDTAVTSSHVVSVDGGTVTILDGGVYVFSGTLSDGQIVVDVKDDEKVQLVLNGVSVTSSTSAAIWVRQADKVFITLADGTENALSSAALEDDAVDAVIYSDEDLTFNGTGTLVIDSPAGSGIDGKDDVKFASGTYIINAAGRGVDSNDSIRIAGGSFTIVSGGTAFRADHDANGELGYIYIWDGSFDITTGGGAANGTSASGDAGFGGMMGGFGPGMAWNGEMPEFTGEDGEMPTPPDYSGEDGEMPAPPDFTGEAGETPELTGEDGEMPTPPDFSGEAGETPEFTGMGEAAGDETGDDGVSARGFKASGDIVVIGGTFALDTADDAFHADGDLVVFDGSIGVSSGDDGLHADGSLTIAGGEIDISQSSEGLEAEVIAISGGDIALVASDDGLNARSSDGEKETFDAQEGVLIEISGGALYVNAGGDGIDSNGDIRITGGTVVVSGPSNAMNGALDYNGTATVTGGTVVAAGASGMAENFSDTSTQAAFMVSLAGQAGDIVVTDANGDALISATVEKSFGCVVVSGPGLAVGETYTVTCGDQSVEITLTDTVTGSDAGGMAGGMMGGGMGGGRMSAPAEEAGAATEERQG